MPTITLPIQVELEDGSILDVVVDQRDMAAFETQPFGVPFSDMADRPFTAYRFMAWNALRRQGKVDIPFEKWSDRCVEARDNRPDPEAEPSVDVADPGSPVQ